MNVTWWYEWMRSNKDLDVCMLHVKLGFLVMQNPRHAICLTWCIYVKLIITTDKSLSDFSNSWHWYSISVLGSKIWCQSGWTDHKWLSMKVKKTSAHLHFLTADVFRCGPKRRYLPWILKSDLRHAVVYKVSWPLWRQTLRLSLSFLQSIHMMKLRKAQV